MIYNICTDIYYQMYVVSIVMLSSSHIKETYEVNPGTPEYKNINKKTFFVTYL